MAATLKISAITHSIQSEGITLGTPSIFMTLTGCKLDCAWCDTKPIWKKGQRRKFSEIIDDMKARGFLTALRRGAHLVLTGGDPLIQQQKLPDFISQLRATIFSDLEEAIYIEIETEGVIQPSDELQKWVALWNVSPKLSNSKMSKRRRYHPEILKWHAAKTSIFKFPIAEESDLEEVDEIVTECGMHPQRIFLMPICATAREHQTTGRKVVEMVKNRGYLFSPRLNLALDTIQLL